jgi:hypothetical protein
MEEIKFVEHKINLPLLVVVTVGIKLPKTFSAVHVSPEIRLPKTFSALYLWKSNLNEITGDHANENYEVNMWVKENVFGSLIPTRLDHQSYQPTTCLNPRNVFLPRCLKYFLPF